MKKKLYAVSFGLTVASLVVSLWGSPSVARPPMFEVGIMGPPPLGDGPGMMLPLLLKGIDLSDEQKARIKEILAGRRDSLRTLFSQLRKAHEEMSAKLFAPGEVRAEDLAPQMGQITQLREQLMRDGLTTMLEVRKVLTPEQLTKAAQVKERMDTLHEEMRSLWREKGGEDKPDEDVLFFQAP